MGYGMQSGSDGEVCRRESNRKIREDGNTIE